MKWLIRVRRGKEKMTHYKNQNRWHKMSVGNVGSTDTNSEFQQHIEDLLSHPLENELKDDMVQIENTMKRIHI